jgi:hypothetical protein
LLNHSLSTTYFPFGQLCGNICGVDPAGEHDAQVKTLMKRPKPIESLILTIRGHKVLIDADLASIYDVETRTLNQAVKRNIERFPEDFIFQLNSKEKSEVITNCDHLNHLKFKSMPFAFTKHGAIMAATVLNSKQAVSMSVFVVRAFVQMREELTAHREILKRLAEIVARCWTFPPIDTERILPDPTNIAVSRIVRQHSRSTTSSSPRCISGPANGASARAIAPRWSDSRRSFP